MKTLTLTGHASVFDSDSHPKPWIEQIDPHAFDKVLESDAEVLCLFGHDPSLELGRRSDGSLYLEADRHGLFYVVDLDLSSFGSLPLWDLVRRRKITGSSFKHTTSTTVWDFEAAPARRRIVECDLVDVGPCFAGRYPAANVNLGEWTHA